MCLSAYKHQLCLYIVYYCINFAHTLCITVSTLPINCVLQHRYIVYGISSSLAQDMTVSILMFIRVCISVQCMNTYIHTYTACPSYPIPYGLTHHGRGTGELFAPTNTRAQA